MDMAALTLIIITLVVIIANVVSDNYQIIYWLTGLLISFAGLLRLYKADKKKADDKNNRIHARHDMKLSTAIQEIDTIKASRERCNGYHTARSDKLLAEFKETNREILTKIDNLEASNNKRFDVLDKRIYELATK